MQTTDEIHKPDIPLHTYFSHHATARAHYFAMQRAKAAEDSALLLTNVAKNSITTKRKQQLLERAAEFTKLAKQHTTKAKLYRMRSKVKAIVRNELCMYGTVRVDSLCIKFYNLHITHEQQQSITKQLAEHNMFPVRASRIDGACNIFVYCK